MKHLFMVLMATLAMGMCAMVYEPEGDVTDISYTVKTGDTVWAIAEKYADCQCKPFNEFVWEIGNRNQLAGKYIHPGDVLIIPLHTRAKK
jgi:hypothetical protein